MNENYFVSYTKHRRGRIRFYQFREFLELGIQWYEYATIKELSKSWQITRKLLKTRSRPKAQMGIMTTFIQLTKQIEDGEVSEETYRNALNLIHGFKQNIRKGENVDRGGVFGLNSIELDLGGQGGGSYKEIGLFD